MTKKKKPLESVDEVIDDLMDEVSKPKKKPRDWSWMDTPEKARKYYEENFPGMSRTQVNEADCGFYQRISKLVWRDHIFPPSKKVNTDNRLDWSWMDTIDKAKEYLDQNFKDMTRSQIMSDKNLGSRFYAFLQRKDWVDDVLPKSVLRDWKSFDLEKAKQFYEDNFSNFTRTQVYREDGAFYDFLKRKGWLDEVLPDSIFIDWSDTDLESCKKFCQENYDGMSRTDIRKVDPKLYALLLRKGWCDEVLPESLNSNHMDWSGYDLDKAKEYYEEHHKDKIRSQVQNEDPPFFQFIQKNDWVDDIFPPKMRQHWLDFDKEDARDFCQKHYPGMIRSQVYKVNSGFYQFVLKNGWQDYVFPSDGRRRKSSEKELKVIDDLVNDGLSERSARKPYSNGAITLLHIPGEDVYDRVA